MDKPTLDRIQLLHPKLREEAMQIYLEICDALKGKAMCRFAYTLRTFAEQDALFNAKPQVTKARGGQSYHNYGLAIDIVLILDKDGDGKFEAASWDVKSDFDGDGKSDWMEVVAIFKRYGWEAGIDWKFYDAPHFQKTLGYSIAQLQALHAKQIANKQSGYLAL
jgi:peptidoglycan L-alanyl-D-glutamate endopeptidase CwlK